MTAIDIGLRDKPKPQRKKERLFFTPVLGSFARVTAALSILAAVFATLAILGGSDEAWFALTYSVSAFCGAVFMGTVYEIAKTIQIMAERTEG